VPPPPKNPSALTVERVVGILPLPCSAFCVSICTFALVKQVNWYLLRQDRRRHLHSIAEKEEEGGGGGGIMVCVLVCVCTLGWCVCMCVCSLRVKANQEGRMRDSI
jgi:hypothetical protein